MATDRETGKRKRVAEEEEEDDKIETSEADSDDYYYENNVNELHFPRHSDYFDPTLPSTIETVEATKIQDSRGFATFEVSVTLYNGIWATAFLPSGAPSGIYHFVDHRSAYCKFVDKDVNYVNSVIGPALIDKDPTQQADIDKLMIEIQEHDGTSKERALRRQKLGLNAIMAVSAAVCKAGAYAKDVPLAQHIADLAGNRTVVLPVPSCRLINGGSHYSDTNLAFQELIITPVGAQSLMDAVFINRMAYNLMEKAVIKKYGLDSFRVDKHGRVILSDEGFTPNIQDVKEALELLKEVVSSSSELTEKVVIGLDAAASEFYESDNLMYDLKFKQVNNDGSGKMSGVVLKDFYKTLMNEYPMIASISNPFHVDDWENYSKLTSEIGTQVQVVMGADHRLLAVGDSERIKKAINEKTCNALLLKVNQIVSVTNCIETVKICKEAGWCVVMEGDCRYSASAGDAFIADLSVGLAVDEIRMANPVNDLTNQFMINEASFDEDIVVFAGARSKLASSQ